MDAAGLADRVTFHEIDFTKDLPDGGDCYLLSDILCDCKGLLHDQVTDCVTRPDWPAWS